MLHSQESLSWHSHSSQLGVGSGGSAVGLIDEAGVLIPVLWSHFGQAVPALCTSVSVCWKHRRPCSPPVEGPGDLWTQCGLQEYAVLVCKPGMEISRASPLLLSPVLHMAVVKWATELTNLPLIQLIPILKVLLTLLAGFGVCKHHSEAQKYDVCFPSYRMLS